PAGIGHVESIALVIEPYAASPKVERVAAVFRAGLQVDPVKERCIRDSAVFLEFGATLCLRGRQEACRYDRSAADNAVPAGRYGRETISARRAVKDVAAPRLKASMKVLIRNIRRIPIGWSCNWQARVRCKCLAKRNTCEHDRSGEPNCT